MDPRKKQSKKWTSFPSEYTEKIEEVFMEAFSEAIGDGKIFIDGRFYKTELFLSIGYLPEGQIGQANFMVSMDFDSSKQNAVQTIYRAIDCAAAMMGQYLEADGDDSEFPRVWDKTEFDGKPVYIQFSPINTTLEAEADKLLGEDFDADNTDNLVKGEDLEEDIDVLKRTIGIGPDDDETEH